MFGGASIAQPIDYSYVQLGVQTHEGHQDLATGYLAGGALGMRFGEGFRAEIEASYQRFNAGDVVYDKPGPAIHHDGNGRQTATYVLGNVWYDFVSFSAIRPYAGGGVGVAFVNQHIDQPDNTLGPSGNDTVFAFQAGAGVNFALAEWVSLDIGYRFRGIMQADIKGQLAGDVHSGQDIYSHNIIAGLTLNF
jgi:opacity protein-like surface antigen